MVRGAAGALVLLLLLLLTADRLLEIFCEKPLADSPSLMMRLQIQPAILEPRRPLVTGSHPNGAV